MAEPSWARRWLSGGISLGAGIGGKLVITRLNGRVRVLSVLRSAATLPLAMQSWLRAVFVLAGAALALALGIAGFTIVSLIAASGIPVWVTAVAGVVLVGGPLLVGMVPAVRQVEGVAAQSLLAVDFPGGPPGPAAGWPQRRRTAGWLVLHVVIGAVVVAAVLGLIALAGSWWTVPAAAATVLGILAAGRFLAWLGPVLLGPSYAERLQRLEADAARATERNRIAREIHDSVGHALSVVTVQASAARKLIGRDPGFAEQALAAIESASRRAAAELDQMLGLLREETQRPAAPAPGLGSLGELITAAGSAGLTVTSAVPGDVSGLPPLVSQEAYRIVQEGLTNALKYSADGTATLEVSSGGDALGIRLSNPAGGRRPARAGRGVRGIDERAGALGGTATIGEVGGRWVVCVALPIREVAP
jgi:signal transduction histidine kinase